MMPEDQEKLFMEVWLRAWTSVVTGSTSRNPTQFADMCLEDFQKKFFPQPENDIPF